MLNDTGSAFYKRHFLTLKDYTPAEILTLVELADAFRKNKKAGCIEEKEIRNGICEIMEGGEEAFKKREAKYMY